MSTIVFLHAHPDDEASQTAGAMARAAAEGHRVVVVFATNGEHGEVPEDLRAGETLADRRRAEAQCSAAALGVSDVRWLGYADSGMTGWAQNADPSSFLAAPTPEAARRLADILDEVDADVLVGYDWHGGYGHPDHVTVHQVVHAAAPMAARTPRLYESTMNRDLMRSMMELGRSTGVPEDQALRPGRPDGRRQPARDARGRDHPARRHLGLSRPAAGGAGLPRQPGHRRGRLPLNAR